MGPAAAVMNAPGVCVPHPLEQSLPFLRHHGKWPQ